jgi:hypothetical protein
MWALPALHQHATILTYLVFSNDNVLIDLVFLYLSAISSEVEHENIDYRKQEGTLVERKAVRKFAAERDTI